MAPGEGAYWMPPSGDVPDMSMKEETPGLTQEWLGRLYLSAGRAMPLMQEASETRVSASEATFPTIQTWVSDG